MGLMESGRTGLTIFFSANNNFAMIVMKTATRTFHRDLF